MGNMDAGELIFTGSRLGLRALASFFAIILWSKTRDAAWMLMVIGTLAAYVETVYSLMNRFGITGDGAVSIGVVPLAAILLSNLPVLFYTIAFVIMVVRTVHHRKKTRPQRKISRNRRCPALYP
jgi:hypothetical protein